MPWWIAAILLAACALCARAGVAPIAAPGWRVELLAESPVVSHPSVICSAPDGRIFVAEDPMDISTPHADALEGRILCRQLDGRWTVFAERLHAVFGMQYLEGRLYVLHNPQFSVFDDEQGVGARRRELIESLNPNPWALDWNDHVPANFKLGMDGCFYLATGDKGIYGAVGRDGKRVDLPGGGVLRLRPDGTQLEVYCTGVRNILDLALNEEDEIFTYDNTDEHDWMGRLSHMVEGGFYGYPHDFVPRRPYTLWMMDDFGAGAACGTLAYTEDALPADYRDNLFLADFGKRQVMRVRVARSGATWRVTSREDFLSAPPEDFRPVGVGWGADGASLLVCDWQHRDTKENVVVGRVWRATFTGPTQAAPKPSWYLAAAMGRPFDASSRDLITALSHPAKSVRLQAGRELGRRGGRAEVEALSAVLLDAGARPAARRHALWALDAIQDGSPGRAAILQAASAPDPALRRQAVRELGFRRAAEATPTLAAALKDAEPSVRLQAAVALGRIEAPDAVEPLLGALAEQDLFARFSVFTALNRIGRARPEAWPRMAAALGSVEARVAEGAVFALRNTWDPALVESLGAVVAPSSTAASSARAAALRLIADMLHRPAEWKGEWGAYHPALEAPPARTNVWSGTVRCTALLTAALDDPDAGCRRIAAEGLSAAEDRRAAGAALRRRFAGEKENEVREGLIQALGRLGDTDFAADLRQTIRDPATSARLLSAAMEAAGGSGSAALQGVLVEVAADAAAPVARRVRALESLGEHKVKASASALKALVLDAAPPVRAAAQHAAARIGGAVAVALLRPLLAQGSVVLRREGVAALGLSGSREAVADLLEARKAAETHRAAVAALAGIQDTGALEAHLEGLLSASAEVSTRCRRNLEALRAQNLPGIEARVKTLPADLLAELRLIYATDPRAKAGPLFAGAREAPPPAEYARFATEHDGDPVRGQRVFFNTRTVGCIRCHTVAGHGMAVGPDLTLIGVQYPRRDLIEHVLEPSKVVREGYAQWSVEMRDGETYSGIVRGEADGRLTLVTSDGRSRSLPTAEIAQRAASAQSLMPEGLQTSLTLEEFADLIAFLGSRRADPRKSEPAAPPAGFAALAAEGDLSGWGELPSGTKRVDSAALLRARPPEHWRWSGGVLAHDGNEGDLWTLRDFGDCELRFEWRWPDVPEMMDYPAIGPDGAAVTDVMGRLRAERVLDAGDSGVFLRGLARARAHLFCYPVGSGEFWDYRTDLTMPPEVRRAATPKTAADRPIGDWNSMTIRLTGNRVTVELNGQRVIDGAELPGLPERGPIGLQHLRGGIQFRNLFVREGP